MDLVCFSHLRWNFVYQRPQHLFSRFANQFRVFFIEEPIYNLFAEDHLHISLSKENVWIIVPYLKENSDSDIIIRQKKLLHKLFAEMDISDYIFWYYTPMALSVSDEFKPKIIIYDCMDELSAFKFAPANIKALESELMNKADIVFTGGLSLYEAKKDNHNNIFPFPSSIDKEHFLKARTNVKEPKDQAGIEFPRIGFFGVIDERLDIELIEKVAIAKPQWQIILIGPIVKIDEATLPKQKNIHYLGSKSYQQLPEYISGWQIAIIPFALNESTRFISPTKTPEYLAAGKPVISTAIKDVVNPYGEKKLVHIIHSPQEFIKSAEQELNEIDKTEWLHFVDEFLTDNSWDKTWYQMNELIKQKLNQKKIKTHIKKKEAYV
ncbi:MAG: glycosyltransferase [Chitinophagaceae bacterium]